MSNIPKNVEEYRQWWQANTDVPYGFCFCGCGQRTNLCKQTSTRFGHFRGEPVRFISGHNVVKREEQYLIEDRGYNSSCWLWQWHIDDNGYGTVNRNGRQQKAHRYYYESMYGEVKPGFELDHLCRVRHCVNPDHLQPVTGAENVHRGDRCKLTAVEVQAIRILAAKGTSRTDIARTFGISLATLASIVKRDTWVDV